MKSGDILFITNDKYYKHILVINKYYKKYVYVSEFEISPKKNEACFKKHGWIRFMFDEMYGKCTPITSARKLKYCKKIIEQVHKLVEKML